jgi:hypothetical protein
MRMISRVVTPALVALSLAVPVTVAHAAVQHRGAGPVSNLTVSGGAQAKQRTVSWTAASSDLPIAAYDIIVKKGSQTLIVAGTTVGVTTYVLKRKDLKQGTDKVTVFAVTKDGPGPKVTVKFPEVKPTHP